MGRVSIAVVLCLTLGCKEQSPPPPASTTTPPSIAAPSASAAQGLTPLDARFEPLVGAFNGAAEQVRVLALLSPT